MYKFYEFGIILRLVLLLLQNTKDEVKTAKDKAYLQSKPP